MTRNPTNTLKITIYNTNTPTIHKYISQVPNCSKVFKINIPKKEKRNDQRFMMICMALFILSIFCIFDDYCWQQIRLAQCSI